MEQNKIKVFYDGQCGLCAKEIGHYKKIAKPGLFDWIDITEDADLFEKLGFKLEEGLKILHVQTRDGDIKKGVDGFIIIWQNLGKNWATLGFLIRVPIIKQATGILYLLFAKWRFKKMGYRCS